MKSSSIKNIRIFGLGYVGTCVALGLSHSTDSHIVGIDINANKVELLNNGKLHILEHGLEQILQDGIKNNRLTFNSEICSPESDVSIVCVGTPARPGGGVDLAQLISLIDDIIHEQKNRDGHVLVIRSTIPPGTMEQAVLPKLSAHPQIKTFYMPEFLREGKALADFLNPNQLLVAGDKESFAKVADIFPGSGELKFASFKSLEMIKYLNNSFHALKVSFANELGTLATSMGVDHNELFDLFLSDRKLNISEEYLRPGFSFGGTCLNKELSALEELGKVNATDLPLLKSIKVSNNVHRDRFLKEIIEKNAKRILFCGVTFKPGTDDLRESPIMDIIHSLRSLPSYKQAPQILIWDHPKVLANLTELSHFDGDFNELEPSDLVVFGPYAVSDENRKILTSHNVQTLELGF